MQTYSKTLPIVATPDVLVCGAGCAGIGAAVAAARNGASTMVIDRLGFAGGFFTAIIGSGFDGFVDERSGAPVVGGIVFEMLERMGVIRPGTGPRTTFNVNGELGEIAKHPDWVVPRCDPERFKRAADRILDESGVEVLFHTQVADVVARSGHVEAVVASNKAGLVAIRPTIVIDCTGDGDTAAWAGCHSATSEALASTRVTATAMGMGQAAGTAAALALTAGVAPRHIAVDQLRATLRTGGVILEPPAVPAGA